MKREETGMMYQKRPKGAVTCCFYTLPERWRKIKKICAMECITLTAFMEKIIDYAIENYEAAHGPIEVPKKKGAMRSIQEIFGKKPSKL